MGDTIGEHLLLIGDLPTYQRSIVPVEERLSDYTVKTTTSYAVSTVYRETSMKIIADSDLRNGSVKLAGEVDLCSVPELRDALNSQVNLGRPALIVDLTEVTFMDSSGLSVIIGFWRQMQELGGKLVIVGAKGEVLEVFRLTHLDQYIPLFATDGEAWVALDMVA